jgi:hypothetical protein
MSKVIVDDELRAKLNGLNADLEFCDPNGEPLGYFVPKDEYMRLLYAWERQQPVDLEELERRAREPGGRPLAEIWKRLGREV